LIQGVITRDVEKEKNQALLEIEKLKEEATIQLEQKKQDAVERLDRAKFETTLILKATEAPNREDQIRNLKFFLNAGFIRDPDNKIAKMDDTAYPSSATPTVLGGAGSSVAEWPWLVSIYTAGGFFCNGTLIASRMVLSAAQCVARGQPADYEVATVTDDGKYVRVGRRIPVVKIVVHPAFSKHTLKSKDTLKNDIAILELGVALPPPFARISAQRSTDSKVGSLALVGTVDFQSQPGSLRQSAVPIADDETCAARYDDKSAREGMICAGSERGGAGACPGTGSAGGPLTVLSDAGRKYQIGIVSSADDCRVPGAAYGLYTRVSSYAAWIRQVAPTVLIESMTEVNR